MTNLNLPTAPVGRRWKIDTCSVDHWGGNCTGLTVKLQRRILGLWWWADHVKCAHRQYSSSDITDRVKSVESAAESLLSDYEWTQRIKEEKRGLRGVYKSDEK